MRAGRVVRHAKTRSALDFAVALAELDEAIAQVDLRQLRARQAKEERDG